MPKPVEFRVKVSGPSPFPVDMLRYDGLVPATERDSSEIQESIAAYARGEVSPPRYDVVLVRTAEPSWRPTVDRWRSRGWLVDTVDQRR